MAPLLVLLSWLWFSFILLEAVASQSSEAPWQSSSGLSVTDELMYGDKPPTVFAPGGRLYVVERTVAAASSKDDPSSNLVMALSYRDGLVILTTSPLSPHLDIFAADVDEKKQDSTSMPLWITTDGGHRPPLARLSSNVWAVTGGNAVDSTMLRYKMSRLAENMLQVNDGGQPLPPTLISCAAFARRVADMLQKPTQTMGKSGRVLASYAILAGRDEQNMCCLWRIDPTGQFWKCYASAVGRGASAAEAHLLELVKARGGSDDASTYFSNLSSQQAVSIACECIGKVLPKENKCYWQALVLSAASDGKLAKSRVLNGEEILSVLHSTAESDTEAVDGT